MRCVLEVIRICVLVSSAKYTYRDRECVTLQVCWCLHPAMCTHRERWCICLCVGSYPRNTRIERENVLICVCVFVRVCIFVCVMIPLFFLKRESVYVVGVLCVAACIYMLVCACVLMCRCTERDNVGVFLKFLRHFIYAQTKVIQRGTCTKHTKASTTHLIFRAILYTPRHGVIWRELLGTWRLKRTVTKNARRKSIFIRSL